MIAFMKLILKYDCVQSLMAGPPLSVAGKNARDDLARVVQEDLFTK
jgi:hypothetical protein